MLTMRKLKVVLNPPRTIGHYILFARFIASRMQGNPYFPAPTVPIATLLAHIDELEALEVQMLSRRAVSNARNAGLTTVKADLDVLAMYVQTRAGERMLDSEAIVASAGMSIKRFPGPGKPAFVVKQGKLSGSVKLVVRDSGRNRTFYWQYSSDGATWIDMEDTVVAHAELSGLTPARLYSFRYRRRTSKGLEDWSQVYTLFVV
jgi:hypothetical protein